MRRPKSLKIMIVLIIGKVYIGNKCAYEKSFILMKHGEEKKDTNFGFIDL